MNHILNYFKIFLGGILIIIIIGFTCWIPVLNNKVMDFLFMSDEEWDEKKRKYGI